MKKKILFFSNNLESKEAKHLINLLKNIDFNNYEIDLMLEENKGIYKRNIPKKVNIIDMKLHSKIKFINKTLSFLICLKFNLRKNKYNCSILYNTNSYTGNYFVRKASDNTILYVHDDYINLSKEEYRNYFTNRNIYDFDNLIFETIESSNNFLKYYPSLSKKTHVINHLVNIEEIEKKSKEKISETIKKTDINILLINELNEEINKLMPYLKIIKDLKEEILNIKLFIIGDGIDKLAYESFIEDNNLQENIYLLGNKKNVYPYIKKSHYVITNKDNLLNIESIMLKTEVISTTKISDGYFELGTNYGFLISKQYNKMKEEIKRILTNKKVKKNKFDFYKINNDKIAYLEELIDSKNNH